MINNQWGVMTRSGILLATFDTKAEAEEWADIRTAQIPPKRGQEGMKQFAILSPEELKIRKETPFYERRKF